MMAAPPVPPRLNEDQLWVLNHSQVRRSTQTFQSSHEQHTETYQLKSRFSQTMYRSSTPPPLPPRIVQDHNQPSAKDDLLLVPPPPNQTAFKSNSNVDLMSFSSPQYLTKPKTLNESLAKLGLNSSISTIPIPSTSRPIVVARNNFPGLSNFVAPPNSPNVFTPMFNNELYFHQNQTYASIMNKESAGGYGPPRWDIPHSHSAPDLAQLERHLNSQPDATHHLQVLSRAINFMKKKEDNNLIDLANDNLSTSLLHQDETDILKLFDPLSKSEERKIPVTVETEAPIDQDETDGAIAEVDETQVKTVIRQTSFNQEIENSSLEVPLYSLGSLTVVNRSVTCSEEITSFAEKVKSLRKEFPANDIHTNVGLVISPTLENNRDHPLSIQLMIDSSYSERPVSFTCDVSTSIEHVISHVICYLFDDTSQVNMENFVLQVHGISEYFSADSELADYEYVHLCHKFDKPVRLKLVDIKDLKQDLARTTRDDKIDINFHPNELLDEDDIQPVTCAKVNILLEYLHKEIDKLKEQAKKKHPLIYPDNVCQAIKAICASLRCIETLEINTALEELNFTLLKFARFQAGPTASNEELVFEMMEIIELSLRKLISSIADLLILFSNAFFVNFQVPRPPAIQNHTEETHKNVTEMLETLLIQIKTVHQIPPSWATYDSFHVTVELRHGKNKLAIEQSNFKPTISKVFFERIVFEDYIEFDFPMCTIPREASLYFFLYGNNNSPPDNAQLPSTLLGWTAMTLFDPCQVLHQGSFLLGLWSEDVSSVCGPACANQTNNTYPILRVNLTEYGHTVKFPRVQTNEMRSNSVRGTLDMLDNATQTKLLNIIGSDLLGLLAEEEKELLWEKRYYLQENSHALPKLLSSVHGWDWACLPEIYGILQEWKPMSPVESLVLLLPDFPDIEIRKIAVKWIRSIGSDELCDYLPQLVQALKFETWLDSPTLWFLLERSMTSVRVAHHLHWLLMQNVKDPVSGQRMKLVLNALNIIIGSSLRGLIQREKLLLGSLSEVAEKIKTTKEAYRLNTLFQELETTHNILQDSPTCLPLSPSLQVCKIDVKNCTYFTSNTLPLKIVFRSSEDPNHFIQAIFKVGDDLRQDMLTLQMIRIMDKLWLKESLDLKIITFGCFATGYKEGMVEMITEAETLRKIHTEHGLTGSFKDRPIAEWLQKHNTSELEYQQAVENFTLSCAGYCVATYILGICDRHNDNIMVKTSGHIFHIDFGKFLGDAQKFGNIKRDRVPFVLTSDMAYVINGGDKPSKRFQTFIDICCQAFNILRKNSSVFLNLFGLMVESGIPGVNSDAVIYVERMLMPNLSEAEATARFSKMIEESLKSWFTQFNFFIHNIALLRFTGDHNEDVLLSFIPKVFTLETDGKILSVDVVGSKKQYDPEKYYVYVVKVIRENSLDPMYVFRSFREFTEFHQKLCMLFPLAGFRPLPRGSMLTRSNIREVAEKRKSELSTYLQSLMGMAEEIAHCSLVYTFFHPLLRDQEGMEQNWNSKNGNLSPDSTRDSTGVTQGHVKLSILYKKNSLFIMIMHAKNLGLSKGVMPDVYVKTYLLPDSQKHTKRKTKIVNKNSHPTFMEMLVYALPYEVVRRRVLQVSAWSYDRLQENEFLGVVSIPLDEVDLKTETIKWYKLDNNAYLRP